eukprot:SM000106S13998  [mRNA]  locus=s106:448979:451693:- [translate_table: standard]
MAPSAGRAGAAGARSWKSEGSRSLSTARESCSSRGVSSSRSQRSRAAGPVGKDQTWAQSGHLKRSRSFMDVVVARRAARGTGRAATHWEEHAQDALDAAWAARYPSAQPRPGLLQHGLRQASQLQTWGDDIGPLHALAEALLRRDKSRLRASAAKQRCAAEDGASSFSQSGHAALASLELPSTSKDSDTSVHRESLMQMQKYLKVALAQTVILKRWERPTMEMAAKWTAWLLRMARKARRKPRSLQRLLYTTFIMVLSRAASSLQNCSSLGHDTTGELWRTLNLILRALGKGREAFTLAQWEILSERTSSCKQLLRGRPFAPTASFDGRGHGNVGADARMSPSSPTANLWQLAVVSPPEPSRKYTSATNINCQAFRAPQDKQQVAQPGEGLQVGVDRAPWSHSLKRKTWACQGRTAELAADQEAAGADQAAEPLTPAPGDCTTTPRGPLPDTCELHMEKFLVLYPPFEAATSTVQAAPSNKVGQERTGIAAPGWMFAAEAPRKRETLPDVATLKYAPYGNKHNQVAAEACLLPDARRPEWLLQPFGMSLAPAPCVVVRDKAVEPRHREEALPCPTSPCSATPAHGGCRLVPASAVPVSLGVVADPAQARVPPKSRRKQLATKPEGLSGMQLEAAFGLTGPLMR